MGWESCNDRLKNEYRPRIKDLNGYENCKGKDCEGDDIEERPCRVDCKWKTWSHWSSCTFTCGDGKQKRSRSILIPAAHRGRACFGPGEQTRNCNIKECQ